MRISTCLRYLSASLLLSLACFNSAQAETALQLKAADHMAQQLGQNFAKKSLAQQDTTPPYLKSVELVIAHSLGHSENELQTFKSLTELEAWLSSREHEGLPGRNSEALAACNKGLCRFEDRGLLHNNLYLRAVSYVYLNGQPYLKTFYLVDGD